MRFLLLALLIASAARADDAWSDWKPLAGTWLGEGSGEPGQATRGEFTFAPDLQGKVLTRRNFSEYAATKDRPAFRHDDLMVLWKSGGATHASYWDNEGHAFEYRCTAAPPKWTCETSGVTPGFRLEYTLTAPDALTLAFSISPSGKPDAFKPYVTARARRK
jgi:hypothetical protein